MFSKKQRYTRVPSDEDEEDNVPPQNTEQPTALVNPPPTPTHRHRTRITLAILLLFPLATLLFYLLFTHLHHPEPTQCGTSAPEARARGCKFEITSFSWLPPSCHDAQIDHEFQAHNQTYYRHANYTSPVPLSEVKLGEAKGFYVKKEYHITHCAYLFKKLHRAYARGGRVDGLVSRLGHSAHCVDMLVDMPEEMAEGRQFAFVKWPYCGRDGGFNIEWDSLGEWTT